MRREPPIENLTPEDVMQGDMRHAASPAAPPRAPERPLTPEDTATARNLGDIMQQPLGNTPMAQQMTGLSFKEIAENARRRLESTNSTRVRVDPTVDKFAPTTTTKDWQSAEAMSLYNDVGPGRIVVWKVKPGIYEGERVNAIEELMHRIPEARIVTNKASGEQMENWDMVAVSVPQEYQDRLILEEADNYLKWEESVEQETQHGSVGVSQRVPDFENRTSAAAAASRNRSRQMGIGTRGVSETANVPYEVALRHIPEADRLETEADERRGGRHMSLSEQQAEALDARRQQGRGGTRFGGLRGNEQYDRWERSGDRERASRQGARTEEGRQTDRAGRR